MSHFKQPPGLLGVGVLLFFGVGEEEGVCAGSGGAEAERELDPDGGDSTTNSSHILRFCPLINDFADTLGGYLLASKGWRVVDCCPSRWLGGHVGAIGVSHISLSIGCRYIALLLNVSRDGRAVVIASWPGFAAVVVATLSAFCRSWLQVDSLFEPMVETLVGLNSAGQSQPLVTHAAAWICRHQMAREYAFRRSLHRPTVVGVSMTVLPSVVNHPGIHAAVLLDAC